MERIALFPGSFDPFTLGHKAIVDQGLRFFDRIVVGVGDNNEKRGMMTDTNRARLIRDIYADEPRVEVCVYGGLTGDYCRKHGILFLLRGMRNTVDYEYERSMMLINQKLYPEITTVLLFTPPEFVAISSSMIRELVSYGGDPTPLMPQNIDIKNYL
ncbi:MAG: pantetheine-phosphate adenylyltransferase [Rikenellaceae bacterium]|nr:pantetheine-phosphate adenylyltransferase [Rikenellaceae bacterium]